MRKSSLLPIFALSLNQIMYNSLAFYYPPILTPTGDTPTVPNVQLQLQSLTNWLTYEHLQHQQWAGIITRDYETNHLHEIKTFVEHKLPTGFPECVCVNFTPLTVMSAKLFHSQLTSCQTRSMFPGLTKHFTQPEGFHPLEGQTLNVLRAFSLECIETSLQPLLDRFVAWFQYSKVYLSFYVRKFWLEENGQLSDVFSSRLLCHWLKNQHVEPQIKWLSQPCVCPTHADVRCHLNRVKERMKGLKAVSQTRLISELHALCQRWVSAWDLSVRWYILSYCDDRLRRLLQKWAKRRHPNKGWAWVCHRYWRVGTAATKCLFWLRLLTHTELVSDVHSQFVNLLQTKVNESMDLDVSVLSQWQFVCLDSDAALTTHTAFTLRKWRKNRSFQHFLLY